LEEIRVVGVKYLELHLGQLNRFIVSMISCIQNGLLSSHYIGVDYDNR